MFQRVLEINVGIMYITDTSFSPSFLHSFLNSCIIHYISYLLPSFLSFLPSLIRVSPIPSFFSSSPVPSLPVAWPDMIQPSAKYHYASFIGQYARLSGVPDQCRQIFPTCSLSGADVINLVASWKFPCNGNEERVNNIRL